MANYDFNNGKTWTITDFFGTRHTFHGPSSGMEAELRKLGLYGCNRFLDGLNIQVSLPNSWAASITKHSNSNGGEEDTWELAVLDSTGSINYGTDITDDVIGWLTDKDVVEVVKQIAKLDEEGNLPDGEEFILPGDDDNGEKG